MESLEGSTRGLRQVGSGAFTGASRSELKLDPAGREVSKSLDLLTIPPSSFLTFIRSLNISSRCVLMISGHHSQGFRLTLAFLVRHEGR